MTLAMRTVAVVWALDSLVVWAEAEAMVLPAMSRTFEVATQAAPAIESGVWEVAGVVRTPHAEHYVACEPRHLPFSSSPCLDDFCSHIPHSHLLSRWQTTL